MPSRGFIAIRGDTVPLLVGPQGAQIEQGTTSVALLHSMSLSATPSDPDPTQAITASPPNTTQSSLTGTKSTSASTSTSSSPSTATASSTNSSSPTSSASTDLAGDGPSQPSSIRFLVPVFLLIFVTLAFCVYRKYRVMRNRRDARSDRPTPSREKGFSVPPVIPFQDRNGGWKEIRDYDDAWEAASEDGNPVGEEQYENQGQINAPRFDITAPDSPGRLPATPSKVSGLAAALSVTNLGWGWRESFSNWRSARSKEQVTCIDDGGPTVLEEKRTIKLVQVSSTTYQSLPPLDLGSPTAVKAEGIYDLGGELLDLPAGDAETKGSMRRLREKLALWRRGNTNTETGRGGGEQDEKCNKRLERNRSPNKRRAPKSKPRMVRDGEAQEGGFALRREDTAPPLAPDWIRPRAASPTAILSPPMQPHLFFAPNPLGGSTYVPAPDWESESEYSCMTGSAAPTPSAVHCEGLGLSHAAAPSRVSRQRSDKSTRSNRNRTSTAGRKSQLAPPSRRRSSKRNKSQSDQSPSMKRSNGLSDLSAASPKPTRKEKRDARAKNEVEGILKASWTDRALASPQATTQDLNSLAETQPLGNLGSVASMGSLAKIDEENRGGIEQILGMAKSP